MRATTRLLPIAAAAFAGAVHAQQLPQLTQYRFNDYLFNPAVAGTRPSFELRSGHRYQWVGVQDAPRTFTLSGLSTLGTNMGVGGYLFTDHVGPTRRTGIQFSYAYHLRLTEDLKLGMALSGGMVQFLIDGSKIQLRDPGDPAMDDQLRGELLPDATFGLLLHHPRFWLGGSAPQILRNEVRFFDEASRSLSRLERHYYAMGGYRAQVGEHWRLEPSFLLKMVAPVPPKLDINLTVNYRDAFWVGAGYRTNDAWCAMVGLWFKGAYQFGYSYDIITSNLRNYSTGTHEVMLAITFRKAGPAMADATP
jgi:type IX secretion system PorP/SprF family membrane protein